jgi:hypothetical protein
MKKLFRATAFLLFLNLVFIYSGQAQSAFEAGIRFGDGFNSFSIDATFPLSKAPRLHTAFYLNDGFDLGLYFDWDVLFGWRAARFKVLSRRWHGVLL